MRFRGLQESQRHAITALNLPSYQNLPKEGSEAKAPAQDLTSYYFIISGFVYGECNRGEILQYINEGNQLTRLSCSVLYASLTNWRNFFILIFQFKLFLT